MSARRIIALVLIYALGSAGWWTLGTVTEQRSGQASECLDEAVESLWGTALVQQAPSVTVAVPWSKERRPLVPTASRVRVELQADHRRKGLIWYPTYRCSFAATYTLVNEQTGPLRVQVHLGFPAPGGTYDAFEFGVDGLDEPLSIDTRTGITRELDLPPGESRQVRLAYRTRGLGEWRYRVDPTVGRVRGLDLEVTTDFADVDYAEGSLSPMSAEPAGSGRTLRWTASDLITTQDVALVVPNRLNPGPLASRITFFAPVCLLFFFVLIITVGIVRGIPIHPMHYLFVVGGFFAFHLLLAYLVDLVDIHLAFAISTAVTIALVTTYLRAALGREFPWPIAVAGQAFFLVLFSYSFFLEGTTGLTVALGSVATLGTLMKVTARVRWEDVFAGKPAFPPLPPEPADFVGPEDAVAAS